MEGWFKFERKWLESGVINRDSEHLAVYVYLCAKAVFEPKQTTFGKEPIVLQPGQLITGRRKIAEDCRITDSKVTRVLTLFEKAGLIEQKTKSACRLITVCDVQLEPQAYHARTTREPQANHARTTSEPQANTNKECKNDKNERAKKTRAGARQKRGADQSIFTSDASYDLSDFLTRAIGMQD